MCGNVITHKRGLATERERTMLS